MSLWHRFLMWKFISSTLILVAKKKKIERIEKLKKIYMK